jgi:cytosolic carboxypeptidase protein 5
LSKHGFSLQNEQAKHLRKHFVFKIVPMLNPDGVSRGYYRMDTKAYNLNRYYMNPEKQHHPTIWSIKKLIV